MLSIAAELGLSCAGTRGVGRAAPELAAFAVPESHRGTAFGADRRFGVACDGGSAYSPLRLDPSGGHALGKAAFFDELAALTLHQVLEHIEGAGDENEQRIGGGFNKKEFRLQSTATGGSRPLPKNCGDTFILNRYGLFRVNTR